MRSIEKQNIKKCLSFIFLLLNLTRMLINWDLNLSGPGPSSSSDHALECTFSKVKGLLSATLLKVSATADIFLAL